MHDSWRRLSAALLLLTQVTVHAQQGLDGSFTLAVAQPAFPPGRGPRVVVDAAHLNFHTADGGYAPFAELLRLDGYRIESNNKPFTAETFAGADVFVIVNAMHEQSEKDWAPLPNLSAFTDAEISEVERWVHGGGSLLLIADHMPLAGHAETLAAAFGVRFQNGFAMDAAGKGRITFRRSDGSLASSPIADGRAASERVDAVTTFTGQAFRLDPGIRGLPVLIVPEGYDLLLPQVAFKFTKSTPRIPAANLLQGALVYHGAGRIAVFGEAAMFTAQRSGPDARPIGMNAPEAVQNQQFALNLLHWLAGEPP